MISKGPGFTLKIQKQSEIFLKKLIEISPGMKQHDFFSTTLISLLWWWDATPAFFW